MCKQVPCKCRLVLLDKPTSDVNIDGTRCVVQKLLQVLPFLRSNLPFSVLPEVELMKERFAKLLLGEDMSGGAKGVCTALAISNAITNLSGKYQKSFQ